MPYVARGDTVYKKLPNGKLKKVGTTKGSMAAYLKALYANSKDKGNG